MVVVKVKSRLDPHFVVEVKAYVLKKLTTFLPESKVVLQMFSALPSVKLADPSYDQPGKIDLLLGAEVYGQIIMDGIVKGPPGTPVAQNTRFGWILSGRISEKNNNMEKCHSVISLHAHLNEDEILRKFLELESESSSYKSKKHLTEEEQSCEELFAATTKRDKTGCFIVKLPFKTTNPSCKNAGLKDIARRQFLSLEKRLMRNPELKEQYSVVINEYLALGHMEVVKDIDKSETVYLPHHAVIRNDKTTTKLRVVFNASCTGTNGSSLNDDLMVGPSLQLDLRHIIMRWRRHLICLVADIVKMFRQVKVADDDLDFQRLFWRDNPEKDLQHLRLLRVTFGTSSAPYLAVRCMQQLVYDDGDKFPLACDKVLKDFYMDDLMTGCESVEEGVAVFTEIKELLMRGGFQLQKWSSNSKELMRRIKEQTEEPEGNLEIKIDDVFKILGLTWNRNSDEFEYTVQLPLLEYPITKRKVISDVARLFDPLGWLAPVITTAKVFIQRIWLSGIQWDEELPPTLLKDWLDYRNEFCNLSNFCIPRWINSKRDDLSFELHGFSDASNVAYSAVVYARIIDRDDKIHVSLLTSKTRVAPVKQVSIPRLELCGAVLLAKLLEEVAAIMDVPKQQLHAWTDSTVVLAWLSSHPSRWKTFVANRVAEILTILDGTQWSHVVSKENPADCASRGISPSNREELELWKKGPNWLYNDIIIYNKPNTDEIKLEVKKSEMKCHATMVNEEGDIFTKFSTLKKLVRVIAYCRRLLPKGKGNLKKSTVLTTKEINESLLTCIRMCQRKYFSEEINNLEKKGKVNKGSKLTSLSPILDEAGTLKVGGRLHQALMNETMKHPILVPHKSHFTTLLIRDAHEKTLHGGPQLVLNYLRSKYWVVNAKSVIRQYIRKCVICIRYAAQPAQQMMGRLPEARVRACRPFYQSGVDYAGPISIRPMKGRGYHSTKGYICLFICMATKAIHLEVVSDMTSQAFLAAFKRFVARRGHVADLWSDNGTTFVGSAKELKTLFDQERSSIANEITEWLATNSTNWHFIPPRAPNFGGLWEAGIKSTKHHLKRIIGSSTLTFEEMTTLLSQIEACLNSRPISQITNYPEDPCPLTPGHFIIGEPLVTVPDTNFEESTISSLKRWHLTQRMLQEFWRRWSREYLTQLQQRYKWTNQASEPNIGDVVLVKEDDLPPARWLHGIITEKHPGLDNLTRVVSLRYKGQTIKRPVSKLIVLPLEPSG